MTEKEIVHPHDRYFKEQFGKLEFARSFFQAYLPAELLKRIDWRDFRLTPGDFVQKALRNRKSDILYQTMISDRKGYFYLHLEHQRKSDPEMAFRIIIYMVNIWEQHRRQYPTEKTIPLIIPMVLYQGKSNWTAPLSLHDVLNVPDYLKPYVPQFSYILTDLSNVTDEEIKGEGFVQLALQIMKYVDSPDVMHLLENLLPLLMELFKSKTGLEYIESMLYYLSETSENLEKDKVIRFFNELPLDKSKKEIIMTLAEQWKQEGKQEGIQEGIQKGIQKGRAEEKLNLVKKQLKIKFGSKANDYNRLLTECSLGQLDQIAENLVKFSTLNEVLKDIAH